MERDVRVQRTSGGARSASGTVVDARASLALWLRGGRAQKNMSLDDVAKVTKIQSRILERLEAGKFDGLPAEVFVRGFVRSFARCVGLDEDEALKRYTACTKAEPPPSAKAFVESMSELAPASAGSVTGFRATPIVIAIEASSASIRIPVEPTPEIVMMPEMGTVERAAPPPAVEVVVETITAEASSEIPVTVEPAESPIAAIANALVDEPKGGKKKRRGKKATNPPAAATASTTTTTTTSTTRKRKSLATGTPVEPMPVVVESMPVEPGPSIGMLPMTMTAIEVAEPTPAPTPMPAVELSVSASHRAMLAAKPETASAAAAFAAQFETAPSAPSLAAPALAPDAIEVVEVPAAAAPVASAADDTTAEIGGVWSPKMPVIATATAPWRLSRGVRATTQVDIAKRVPSLTIDDADPEVADKEREDRLADTADAARPRARSFLPPILLDRDDRSGRQGGLTLAVIILLIAATLTLSYLMRRPSASGDGYTLRETPATATHLG